MRWGRANVSLYNVDDVTCTLMSLERRHLEDVPEDVHMSLARTKPRRESPERERSPRAFVLPDVPGSRRKFIHGMKPVSRYDDALGMPAHLHHAVTVWSFSGWTCSERERSRRP